MSSDATDPRALNAEPQQMNKKPPGQEKAKSGEATAFWLELKPYGGDEVRSLWLWVDGAWRKLDKPEPHVESAVQTAFVHYPDFFQVLVWYKDEAVVGLVVQSKK